MTEIYLDYNATTPVDPRVAEAMWPYVTTHFGNPSSDHERGRTARAAVATARGHVAALLGAEADEIVFTGGGSEANNLAIKGVALSLQSRGNHVIASRIEHPAVLEPLRFLERYGFRVTRVPVDGHGRVSPSAVEAAILPETILITIMHANNEVGTLQPLAEIGTIARSRGILLHTDAAQSVGKVPVRVNELQADLLTVAGHKLYAPKGIGALYVRRGVPLVPLVHGAGHESGRRAGTENVPSIVGLGEACRLASDELTARQAHQTEMRDFLHRGLRELLGSRLHLNGHPTERLPNTLNVAVEGCRGGELLRALGRVAASTGSACHSGEPTMSPVLQAMGVPEAIGLGAMRFSVGRWNTREELEEVLSLFRSQVFAARC